MLFKLTLQLQQTRLFKILHRSRYTNITEDVHYCEKGTDERGLASILSRHNLSWCSAVLSDSTQGQSIDLCGELNNYGNQVDFTKEFVINCKGYGFFIKLYGMHLKTLLIVTVLSSKGDGHKIWLKLQTACLLSRLHLIGHVKDAHQFVNPQNIILIAVNKKKNKSENCPLTLIESLFTQVHSAMVNGFTQITRSEENLVWNTL